MSLKHHGKPIRAALMAAIRADRQRADTERAALLAPLLRQRDAHNLDCAATGGRSYAMPQGASARTVTAHRNPQGGVGRGAHPQG